MTRILWIRGVNPAHVGSLFVLIFGLILTTFNLYKLSVLQQYYIKSNNLGSNHKSLTHSGLKYTAYGKNLDSGYLKHVFAVLERAGYTRVDYNQSSDWNVMWAHKYPFKKIYSVMKSMKAGQKVSKFPGTGFVTNKVNLATSGLDHIPQAWKIPADTSKVKK